MNEKKFREEVAFWEIWVSSWGLQWEEDFLLRIKPNLDLQESKAAWICDYLDEDLKDIHLLDVGAGPLTILGKYWNENKLRITPIDPLAQQYREILRKNKITPIIPTIYGKGETLCEQFSKNSFELVFARNSIDHSQNPLKCIEQMLEVVKKGSYVLLTHKQNEGKKQHYQGLHQWNFSLNTRKNLLLWNKNTQINLNEYFENKAEIQSWLDFSQDYLYTSLKKQNPP